MDTMATVTVRCAEDRVVVSVPGNVAHFEMRLTQEQVTQLVAMLLREAAKLEI